MLVAAVAAIAAPLAQADVGRPNDAYRIKDVYRAGDVYRIGDAYRINPWKGTDVGRMNPFKDTARVKDVGRMSPWANSDRASF